MKNLHLPDAFRLLQPVVTGAETGGEAGDQNAAYKGNSCTGASHQIGGCLLVKFHGFLRLKAAKRTQGIRPRSGIIFRFHQDKGFVPKKRQWNSGNSVLRRGANGLMGNLIGAQLPVDGVGFWHCQEYIQELSSNNIYNRF